MGRQEQEGIGQRQVQVGQGFGPRFHSGMPQRRKHEASPNLRPMIGAAGQAIRGDVIEDENHLVGGYKRNTLPAPGGLEIAALIDPPDEVRSAKDIFAAVNGSRFGSRLERVADGGRRVFVPQGDRRIDAAERMGRGGPPTGMSGDREKEHRRENPGGRGAEKNSARAPPK